jgi:hypothetical protein
MVLCGGYSDVKPADADVQALFGSPEVRHLAALRDERAVTAQRSARASARLHPCMGTDAVRAPLATRGGLAAHTWPLPPHPPSTSSTTTQALAAIGAALGKPVAALVVQAYRTQVVAGLNYRVQAALDGGEAVIVTAFKPLPHTGAPLEVKAVVAGEEL